MAAILLIVYLVAGYWATGQTIYRNKIIIEYKFGDLFIQRVCYAALLGWILIPVAIIRTLIGR